MKYWEDFNSFQLVELFSLWSFCVDCVLYSLYTGDLSFDVITPIIKIVVTMVLAVQSERTVLISKSFLGQSVWTYHYRLQRVAKRGQCAAPSPWPPPPLQKDSAQHYVNCPFRLSWAQHFNSLIKSNTKDEVSPNYSVNFRVWFFVFDSFP